MLFLLGYNIKIVIQWGRGRGGGGIDFWWGWGNKNLVGGFSRRGI